MCQVLIYVTFLVCDLYILASMSKLGEFFPHWTRSWLCMTPLDNLANFECTSQRPRVKGKSPKMSWVSLSTLRVTYLM